jgi:hypothetical protein
MKTRDNDDGDDKYMKRRNHDLISLGKYAAHSTFLWMFVPIGFPHSVSKDYVPYQFWDTIQGFIGYLKSIILTLAFLKGLGVGQQGSTIADAMTIWIARDTTGVLAGLIIGMPTFTKMFSQRSMYKHWRILSEIIRTFTGFVEIYISCYDRSLYLPVTCVLVVFDTLANIMSSQASSALITHFARMDNIADCKAKEGNQDRGVKLFGIPLAALILDRLRDNVAYMFILYIILVALQFVCNVLAVYSLQISTTGHDDAGSLAS